MLHYWRRHDVKNVVVSGGVIVCCVLIIVTDSCGLTINIQALKSLCNHHISRVKLYFHSVPPDLYAMISLPELASRKRRA